MTIKNLDSSLTTINTIAHIADVHIRPYKRHREFKYVFDTLYKSLKNKKPDLIILAGDIVHAKTEMSPELVYLTSDLFKNISSIAPTIVIPGNHDANLNNPNRLDALTPIINNINCDNLYYLKESGVYSIGNLYFTHMSVFDSVDKYIRADSLTDISPKIALYHGIVNEAKNDFNFKLTSKINTTFFNGYDFVFLGDIHRMQSLQKYEEEEIEIDEEDLEKYLDDGWEVKND